MAGKGKGAFALVHERRQAALASLADFEFEGLNIDELRVLFPGVDSGWFYKDMGHWVDLGMARVEKNPGGLRWWVTETGKTAAVEHRTMRERLVAARQAPLPVLVPPGVGSGVQVDWKAVAEELRDRLTEQAAEIVRLKAELEEVRAVDVRAEVRAFLAGQSNGVAP